MKKNQIKTLALNISKLKTLEDTNAVKGGGTVTVKSGSCILSGAGA